MSRHMVTCQECGRRFDANLGGSYSSKSRRYLCKNCTRSILEESNISESDFSKLSELFHHGVLTRTEYNEAMQNFANGASTLYEATNGKVRMSWKAKNRLYLWGGIFAFLVAGIVAEENPNAGAPFILVGLALFAILAYRKRH